MEFKIDTKPTYTIITPVDTAIDANMSAALYQKWAEIVSQGGQNCIVDCTNCHNASTDGIDPLLILHEYCYTHSQSLVFTNVSEEVHKVLKAGGATDILNIAPQLIEAIDIVSMEILERDLYNEFGEDEEELS